MTDKLKWKNEPTITDLKYDFDAVRDYQRAHVSKLMVWKDNLNITGNASIRKKTGHSSVQPKLIRKQAEWRIPSLTEPFLSTENVISIKPRSWEDREAANQNELLINYQFNNKINKIHFFNTLVRKLVTEGTSIVRTGWNFSTKEEEVNKPVYEYLDASEDPEFMQILEQAIQLKSENENGFTSLPDMVQESVLATLENGQAIQAIPTGKFKKEIETKIVHNEPTLEVIPTENIYIDPACQGDIDKAKFVIHQYETSIADLKISGNYKNLDLLVQKESDTILAGMTDDEVISSTPVGYDITGVNRKRFIVTEYWGYWDIHGTGELEPIVACYTANNVMIRLDKNPYPDGKPPFVVVPYIPIPGSVYGEPDGELIADNQAIIGATTRALIDLIGKSANAQQVIEKDTFDPINFERFMNGEDCQANINQMKPLQERIQMMTVPPVPDVIPLIIQYQNQEAESLSGVKTFSNGLQSESYGNVAAGIRGILDAGSKRELDILRRIKEGVINIAKKVISMNQHFLSDEEIIRVTNESFISIKREALAGEFDLVIDITTAEEDDAKAKELAFMAQTMGSSLPFELNQLILSEIAKLRKMPDLAHQISKFVPQPDEMEQHIKQLEILKLQSEIEERKARAAHWLSSAGLNQSKKDMTDLDFVEQESGVKQAREKELRAAQSEAQLATKIVEHQLKNNQTTTD